MLAPLRQLRERLSGAQIAGLAALGVLVSLLSYAGWVANDHEWVRQEKPRWVFEGHVMYDGYGNYAHALHYLATHPDAETWGHFRHFLRDYLHASRFAYPALVALVALPTGSILWSGVAVTVAFSFLSLLMFLRIAADHFDYRGRDLFWIGALFATHISVMGAWTRAMADPMALFCLLGVFYWSVEAARSPRKGAFARLGGFLLLGACAKATLLAMAFALPVLAMILARGKTSSRMLAGLALCLAAPPGALALMLGAAELVGMGESAGALFAKKALGSLGDVFSFGWALYAAKAGLLVGVLTFQAHPLFAMVPRGEDAPESLRFSWRDPRWAVPAAWIAIYLFQRLLFSGYHMGHSRARYGLPLVPSALLLAYPGMAVLAARYPWAKRIPAAIVAANLGVWIVFLAARSLAQT